MQEDRERLNKYYGALKVEHVHEILSSNLLLDNFQDWLSLQYKDMQPISTVLQEALSIASFPSFLSLLKHSNSPLAHAKVLLSFIFIVQLAMLTSEFLQSGKSKVVVENMINTLGLFTQYKNAEL